MEEQQMNLDEIFRQSGLGRDYREAPPPAAWDQIVRRLDEEDEEERRPYFWMRMPWAIVCLVLAGAGLWVTATRFAHNSDNAAAKNHTEVSGQNVGGQSALSQVRKNAPIALIENEPAPVLLENSTDPKNSSNKQKTNKSAPSHSHPIPAGTSRRRDTKATSNIRRGITALASGTVGKAVLHTEESAKQPLDSRMTAAIPQSRNSKSGEPVIAAAAQAISRNETFKSSALHVSNASGNISSRFSAGSPAQALPGSKSMAELWPAHMAPARAATSQYSVEAFHNNLVSAAQLINDITNPVLEYDVILSPRPANTPILLRPPFANAPDSMMHAAQARQISGFSLAALAGMERGNSPALQYRISLGGRMLWHFNSAWAIGVQPALRFGHLANVDLTATQAYQNITTEVNGTIIQTVSPSVLNAIDTLFSYVIRQTVDSIVVKGRQARSNIWEVELPLIADFQHGNWHIYGGPSLIFGGRYGINGGGSSTYSTIWRDSIVQSVPMPKAAFASYFGNTSTLPQYSTYNDNMQQIADVRSGYLFGVGWERGRLLLDASIHGQFSGSNKIPEPLRPVYSGPGFRLSVGYLLMRTAAERLKANP